ncbi:hypothetical protein FNF29_06088 [Cafeteria roenbergensis]|uniref:Ubiquitin-like protease family profile domain-containing protein n=1 Tax=Cafeteria roenbergensis TaxID=33653 RepID=A0A5A8CBN2_CAFRO|nr:hypothetical protein FNF29_06088 [Cafeteria roenbergensis]|eukprot:KAA0149201.1 hypothetical protein FNF29_06088 [Cafeteria roenbergensis]
MAAASAASFPGATEHWFDYCGASVYQADVDLLRPGQWLNDIVITFAVDYVSHELAPDRTSWRFCHPPVSAIARFEDDPEDLRHSLFSLRLESRDVALFPVNDNPFGHVAGGTHWSLLVFRRRDPEGPRFLHFDSRAGSNAAVAKDLAGRLAKIVCPDRFSPVSVVEAACPQQNNSSDCGVFTVLVAEALGTGATDEAIAAIPGTAGAAHRRTLLARCEEMRRKTAAAKD